MENIHKLISVATLMSAMYGETYASADMKDYDSKGNAIDFIERFTETEPYCWLNFSEEFKRKFQIGPYSLGSSPWRIFPIYFPEQKNPWEGIIGSLSYIYGMIPDEKQFNDLRRIVPDLNNPFSQKLLLATLAVLYRKNIILLEVGSGNRFKPDFFEKLTIVQPDIGTFERQSGWFEDRNILEVLDDEGSLNLFMQGDKTATFVYHKKLKKIFFCALSLADKPPCPIQEGEAALNEHVKKMNKTLANRWDHRMTNAAGEALKDLSLNPRISINSIVDNRISLSVAAEFMLADQERIMMEEIQIYDTERARKGLKILRELMDENNLDEIKAYFTELAQRFGRETTDPLGNFRDVEARIRYYELMVFENFRQSQNRPGLSELETKYNRREINKMEIMAYFTELAQYFGRKTTNPLADHRYIKSIINIPAWRDPLHEALREAQREAWRNPLFEASADVSTKTYTPAWDDLQFGVSADAPAN
ncbi:MAG: hypothetical protein LBJ71_00880 [Holosporaceae bacterium]|jgi:hypothetical protein|nr:hypothetical protein [Holosporaceae bacterium]